MLYIMLLFLFSLYIKIYGGECGSLGGKLPPCPPVDETLNMALYKVTKIKHSFTVSLVVFSNFYTATFLLHLYSITVLVSMTFLYYKF